jgi:hypothetical protein
MDLISTFQLFTKGKRNTNNIRALCFRQMDCIMDFGVNWYQKEIL